MELIIKALLAKYEADKSVAIAELSTLIQNPTSISQHSSLVNECDTKIQQIADAEGKLLILKNIIAGANNGNNSEPTNTEH